MKKSIILSLFMTCCFASMTGQEQVWEKIGNFSDNTLRSIHFPTKNTGYIVGDGSTLLKTTNGGAHWTTLSVSDARGLYSVHFTNENTGFTAGRGAIYKTTDGGKTWKETKQNDFYDFNCLFFQSSSMGFAAGWLSESSRLIHKTTDAGNTWTGYPVQLNGNYNSPIINGIAFSDSQTGYAVGEYDSGVTRGLLLKTTDGGKTWKEENPSIIASFQDIIFVNSKTGFIAGNKYLNEPGESGYKSIVLKTTDGGKTWSKQIFPSVLVHILSMHFPDEQTGYFSTLFSEIYKTSDGGETWKPQKIDGLQGSTCLFFTDKETGFVGGMYGEVFKSTPILPGIEEGTADALPAAFPNPARETVTLPYSLTKQNEGVLKIFNAGGVLMEQVKVTNDENMVRIGLDGFPAGVYFYSCDGKSGKFTVE